MNKKDREAFYLGAALFMDLESEEVDQVLTAAGISAKTHSIADCRLAFQIYYPLHYEAGRKTALILKAAGNLE